MQTHQQRSHYSEVAAPAANSPKQFGILRAVHKYNLAICEHNFRAEQIIERQTESRQKRAVAASDQQTGKANYASYSGYCSKRMWTCAIAILRFGTTALRASRRMRIGS